MRPLFAFAGLAFLALSACHASHEEVLELRTYDVPKGSASSLMTTFKDLMWMGDNKLTGRAVVTPDGRLAVLATPSVQTGVQALVDEVTKHPPTSDQTVELHYFLVLAKPGAATPYPVGSTEIKAALDEIAHSQGPQSFSIVSRAALSSLHDEEARLDNFGEKLEIRQFAVQTGDGVYAKVSIRSNEDKVETRVHLAADKLVVLGTAGRAIEGAEGATLYYVVRVAPR